ncbi:OHCU decarboxylase [Pseudomonas hunanensis]|nr:OHCU decarboxylase [Pseudomonas hunanensis]
MTAFKTLKPSTLDRAAFVAAFADIYEHSPWVAEKAYDLGQLAELDEIEALHQRMSDILLSASHAEQLALINAHPDLAGKAAIQWRTDRIEHQRTGRRRYSPVHR